MYGGKRYFVVSACSTLSGTDKTPLSTEFSKQQNRTPPNDDDQQSRKKTQTPSNEWHCEAKKRNFK
jgi:hypothetical protein